MALNFPNSPTDGQQFTYGGTIWEWSASANTWSVKRPVSVPDAPADGSDYIRRNNAWVRTGQKVLYTNPISSITLTPPSWAKKLRYDFRLFITSASSQGPAFQLTAAGVTFSSAGDYSLNGYVADAAAGTVSHYNGNTTFSYMLLANNHSHVIMPCLGAGTMELEINNSGQNFSQSSTSARSFQAGLITSEWTNWLANGKTSAVRLDNVRFINSIGANWQSGSYFAVEWLP